MDVSSLSLLNVHVAGGCERSVGEEIGTEKVPKAAVASKLLCI